MHSNRTNREKFQSQKQRLHELFGQIEKEFEILWEENQERIASYCFLLLLKLLLLTDHFIVRKKLDDVMLANSKGQQHGNAPKKGKFKCSILCSWSIELSGSISARLNPLKVFISLLLCSDE